MELRQLRYAVALSRELHFQKAARRMNVTQPTLSQQVKKLEDELGAALFERSPQGVKLTPAGRTFIPRAIAILDQVTGSIDALRKEAGEAVGVVRLGAIPTICPYLIPKVLRQLKTSAPKVVVELYEETTSILIDHLKSGKLDVGILALPINDRGISSLSLGREPFYLALAPRHPLAKRRRIHPKEILKERILILQEGHCFRDQSLEYCKLSAKDPQVIFQGGSLTSVMELAAAGEGVTFVPEMAVGLKGPHGLRYVPFVSPQPTRELGIIWRLSAPVTRAQQAIMESVEAALRQK